MSGSPESLTVQWSARGTLKLSQDSISSPVLQDSAVSPKYHRSPRRVCIISYSPASHQPCSLLPMYAATSSGHGSSGEEALLRFGTFSSAFVHHLSFPHLSVVQKRAFSCYDLHSTGLMNYLPVYSNCITWACLDLTGMERKNTKAMCKQEISNQLMAVTVSPSKTNICWISLQFSLAALTISYNSLLLQKDMMTWKF